MPLALDHVFVCCDRGAPEAEALRAAGFAEGSGNVHEGQGTANRRFFFTGGYLELLWVEKEREARSRLTAPTRLYERWAGRNGDACPFGIGFSPADEVGAELPFEAWAYRPKYLPADAAIHFAKDTSLQEAELFCLPWPRRPSTPAEPRQDPARLGRLVSVSVGMPEGRVLSQASRRAQAARLVGFHRSARYELVMGFRAHADITFDLRPVLPLVLRGTEGSGW